MERTLYVLPLLRVLVLLKRSKEGQKRPLEKFRVLEKKRGEQEKRETKHQHIITHHFRYHKISHHGKDDALAA